MAATPPHAVVVCPPSRHVSSSQRHRERNPVDNRKIRRRVRLSIFVVAAVIITGGVLLGVFLNREFPTGDPVFSVAMTGVAGLDSARDLSASAGDTLSPAFNLTQHIDNTRNSQYRACVPELSTAAVSYGDAVLANGTVPAFCAEEKRESERVAARASGDAVAVPRVLRDQMAGEMAVGEAEVDVKVTMPRYEALGASCGDAVLSCKAKIGVGVGVGAGPSPACRLDYVKTCYDHQSEYLPPIRSLNWPPIYLYT